MNDPGAPAALLLVVDDDPVNAELLAELLRALEYRVVTTLSGAAALEAVRERRPELVLLDVMMPGMNGYEVCRRLKADPETAAIPVVFVTALSDTDDKVRAIEAGGDDFLTKPFSRPVLVARIRSLLRLKHAGDELAESYRRLRELERLKDDLTRMVVHDLKSPLTSVLGTLELAVDGDLGPLAPEQRRLLADAHRRGADVLLMIDNLLDLTRLEESRVRLQLREVEVGRLLAEVAEDWSVRAELQGARVAAQGPPAVRVRADEALLRRVLANLVGNALRHAGPGVKVSLSALPAGGADEGVQFTVADDGVGIPDALHEVIFRKHASGRAAEGGEGGSSGLGLTFCKLAVEAHGGSIWVQSHEGEGSRFHFVLPAQPAGAAGD
ncbi:MAG TPA: response regulator [Longimicrobiaceae bacterium]|nr:response regulator [Longimicrobiaceae bacterium]